MNRGIVERSNIEQPFFGRGPPKLVISFLSLTNWIQPAEEQGKDIYLPVMSRFCKANVPLIGATRKLKVGRYRGVFRTNSTI